MGDIYTYIYNPKKLQFAANGQFVLVWSLLGYVFICHKTTINAIYFMIQVNQQLESLR